MKYYSVLILALLLSVSVFAQPNREELPLQDEEDFDMSFQFQYEGEEPITVTFGREDKTDYIYISNVDCRVNDLSYDIPIADQYAYEQFLVYLQDINILNFQPTQNSMDENAKLNVRCSINVSRTWTFNAFVFLHNPDNIGEESQILEYIVKVLTDNVTGDCYTKIAEKLSIYVNGED